jgi:hypothetical protein
LRSVTARNSPLRQRPSNCSGRRSVGRRGLFEPLISRKRDGVSCGMWRPRAAFWPAVFAAVISVSACDHKANTSDVPAKAKCADIGRSWAERRQSGMRPPGVMLMRPEFAYNRKLDTCLCMLGSWDNSNSGSTRECAVWDTLANRPLAIFATANGQPASELSEAQFGQRATELMGSQQDCSSVRRWMDR